MHEMDTQFKLTSDLLGIEKGVDGQYHPFTITRGTVVTMHGTETDDLVAVSLGERCLLVRPEALAQMIPIRREAGRRKTRSA